MTKSENESRKKQIETSLAHVQAVAAMFADVRRMTPAERMRAPKMRQGGEAIVPLVAHLLAKFSLEFSSVTAEEMVVDLDRAAELQPLIGALTAVLETVRDEQMQANASAWKKARIAYAVLKQGARGMPSLGDELARVRRWFRPRRKATGSNEATDPLAPVGTAAS